MQYGNEVRGPAGHDIRHVFLCKNVATIFFPVEFPILNDQYKPRYVEFTNDAYGDIILITFKGYEDAYDQAFGRMIKHRISVPIINEDPLHSFFILLRQLSRLPEKELKGKEVIITAVKSEFSEDYKIMCQFMGAFNNLGKDKTISNLSRLTDQILYGIKERKTEEDRDQKHNTLSSSRTSHSDEKVSPFSTRTYLTLIPLYIHRDSETPPTRFLQINIRL